MMAVHVQRISSNIWMVEVRAPSSVTFARHPASKRDGRSLAQRIQQNPLNTTAGACLYP